MPARTAHSLLAPFSLKPYQFVTTPRQKPTAISSRKLDRDESERWIGFLDLCKPVPTSPERSRNSIPLLQRSKTAVGVKRGDGSQPNKAPLEADRL